MTQSKIGIIGTDPVGVIMASLLFHRGHLVDIIVSLNPSGHCCPFQEVNITGSLDLSVPVFCRTIEQMDDGYDFIFLLAPTSETPALLKRVSPHLHPDGVVCILGAEECASLVDSHVKANLVLGDVTIDAKWENVNTVCCTSSAQHMVYGNLFELSGDSGTSAQTLEKVKSLLESAIGSCCVTSELKRGATCAG
jgi:2-dehydropantoate 2-reductase